MGNPEFLRLTEVAMTKVQKDFHDAIKQDRLPQFKDTMAQLKNPDGTCISPEDFRSIFCPTISFFKTCTGEEIHRAMRQSIEHFCGYPEPYHKLPNNKGTSTYKGITIGVQRRKLKVERYSEMLKITLLFIRNAPWPEEEQRKIIWSMLSSRIPKCGATSKLHQGLHDYSICETVFEYMILPYLDALLSSHNSPGKAVKEVERLFLDIYYKSSHTFYRHGERATLERLAGRWDHLTMPQRKGHVLALDVSACLKVISGTTQYSVWLREFEQLDDDCWGKKK